MSVFVVPADQIEGIVGVERHAFLHYGRAVTEERMVYVLHSRTCFDSGIDLRDCVFSLALDNGIDEGRWTGYEDRPVVLRIEDLRLIPERRAI